MTVRLGDWANPVHASPWNLVAPRKVAGGRFCLTAEQTQPGPARGPRVSRGLRRVAGPMPGRRLGGTCAPRKGLDSLGSPESPKTFRTKLFTYNVVVKVR